jgi:hypothetical protein
MQTQTANHVRRVNERIVDGNNLDFIGALQDLTQDNATDAAITARKRDLYRMRRAPVNSDFDNHGESFLVRAFAGKRKKKKPRNANPKSDRLRILIDFLYMMSSKS